MRPITIFLLLKVTLMTACFAVAANSEEPPELQLAETAMATDLDLAEKHIEKALANAPQDVVMTSSPSS